MSEDKRERIQIRISREERLKAKIKLAQANIRWQDLLYPALARWINECTLEIDTPSLAAIERMLREAAQKADTRTPR